MKPILTITPSFYKRVPIYSAYMATAYYIEIINLMFLFLVLFGKLISVISGIILAFLLAVHIIRLYFRHEIHRKIQLIIADLHSAYVIAFCISRLYIGTALSTGDTVTLLLRVVLLIFDLFMIYFLSKSGVTTFFRERERITG